MLCSLVSDVNKQEIIVPDSDIQFQEYRASGAGGQHRNKNATAIRATHIPSGLSVTAEDSKSQHINKQTAKAKIVKLLSDNAFYSQLNLQKTNKNNQILPEGFNPRSSSSWVWTAWRDEVFIPTFGKMSMKKALKGKFEFDG